MAKEIIVNEEKQTLWSRFTSWLASSWLGKAWKSITGLFSSNKASSKASGATNQSKSKTPDNDEQSQDNSKGTNQQQEPLAAAFSKETPEVESPATPDNGGGRCFMDNDGNTVISNSNQSTAPGPNPTSGTSPTPNNNKRSQSNGQGADQGQEPEIKGFSGRISVLRGESLELNLASENYSKLQEWKNSANPEEFHVFINCDNGNFRITGRYDSKKEISGRMITINSVANQDGTNASGNLKQMKAMLGLDGAKDRIEINEISNVPFIPKVESTATPEQPKLNNNSNGVVVPEGKKLVFSPELSDLLSKNSLENARKSIKIGTPSSSTTATEAQQAATDNGKSQ